MNQQEGENKISFSATNVRYICGYCGKEVVLEESARTRIKCSNCQRNILYKKRRDDKKPFQYEAI